MSYAVKECFYTLQGEGAHTGRAAVFLRFTGCNLWSGREEDRAGAVCRFCDTDFVGTDGQNGGRYSREELGALLDRLWPGGGRPYVVCTGGEPLLQLDAPLIREFRRRHFEVAIETNGTLPLPAGGVDWVCLSPKAGAAVVLERADEIKLVYPQPEAAARPEAYTHFPADHYFLQPKAEAGYDHTPAVVRYCLDHPRWRISLQTHKLLGID